MQAIRSLIRVSTLCILLSYNEIVGMLPDSRTTCADISTRRTVLKPYMSVYDEMFKVPENKTCTNKSRNVLSATVKKTIRAPFAQKSWDEIRDRPTINTLDDMTKFFDKIHVIFYDLLDLILLKIDVWLTSPKTARAEKIEKHFEFKSELMDFVNNSITELMSQQREGIISINTFFTVLYIIFDIKNVAAEDSEFSQIALITKNFKTFHSNFGDYLEDVKKKGQTLTEDNLIKNYSEIEEKTKPSFGVTITSMKMKLLINQTNNKPLKTIQNLKPSNEKTISEYVESYAREFDAIKINMFHVSILSVLITHAFGYVHNHFQLLLELRKHEIYDVDKKTIEMFSVYMNGYMSILVERYFEFKGEISQEIVDAMFPIMFFLTPSDPQYVDDKNFTKEEKKHLSETQNPKVSLLNYYDTTTSKKRGKNEDVVEVEIKNLIDNAVKVLKASFVGTAVVNAEWNKGLKMNFKKKDKKTLLNEIKNNNDDAISILKEFSCAFTV